MANKHRPQSATANAAPGGRKQPGYASELPTGVLWKPHKTIHTRAVCCKKHFSPNSGLQIRVGYTINFITREYRNRWLVAQYPRTYRRLA